MRCVRSFAEALGCASYYCGSAALSSPVPAGRWPANVTHTPEQRLAKWLLLARDRTIADDLPYTQESLARILGVRRPTVSEAAEALKDRGLIEYHRGNIRVSDRAGLEEAACTDYQAFVDEYERLLGPAPA